MRRVFGSAALIGLLGFGGTALARPARFLILNGSSWSISYVYISPTSVSEWGPDQLGSSQVIGPGQTFTINDIPCDTYDVKVVSSEGVECVLTAIRMCRGAANYTITDASLAECSGAEAPASIGDLLARLSSAPNDDEILGDLGDAYAAQGDSASARKYYLQAFRNDPGDSEWQRQVVDFGAGEEAVAYLSGIVSATDDERLGDLGDLLHAVGRTGEACERWHQAYTLDTGDSEWGGKLGEHCPSYGITGPTEEGDGGADLTAGREALARGDKETARTHFEAALAKDPTSKGALIGMVLATGRPGTAILQDLATRVQNNDELWGDLGDAWVMMGDTAKARDAYLRAAVLDPEDGEWKRAIEILGLTAP